MNDEHDSLEHLLRGLNPTAPNPELRERVAADLRLDEAWLPRQVRRAPRWVVAAGWAGLGAAAAVAVMGMMMRDFAPTTTDSSNRLADKRAVPTDTGLAGKGWSTGDGAGLEANGGVKSEAKTEPKTVLPVNFQ